MLFRPERFLASGRSSTKYQIKTQLFLAEIRFSLASSSSRQHTRKRTDAGHNETWLSGLCCCSQKGSLGTSRIWENSDQFVEIAGKGVDPVDQAECGFVCSISIRRIEVDLRIA